MFKKYIGIPFVDNQDTLKGADCFGLCRLVYNLEKNIEILTHKSDPRDIRNIMLEYAMEAKTNWINVEEPKVFDIIAMAHDINHPRIVQHYGIYIGKGEMIHTLKEIGSHKVKVKDYKYFIKAIHRHKDLING